MKSITLSAHFDGEQICLDEPFELTTSTKLLVTVLLEEDSDDERKAWLRLAESSLAAAYGENEPEYPLHLIKEPNPDYEEGDVILSPVPQADGKIKNRPAIILRKMPPYQDLLVCGVSTQLHQKVDDFNEVIFFSDTDFKLSGLLSESLIRLSFLAVLPRKNIIGSIGAISTERHQRLLKTLSSYLVKDCTP